MGSGSSQAVEERQHAVSQMRHQQPLTSKEERTPVEPFRPSAAKYVVVPPDLKPPPTNSLAVPPRQTFENVVAALQYECNAPTNVTDVGAMCRDMALHAAREASSREHLGEPQIRDMLCFIASRLQPVDVVEYLVAIAAIVEGDTGNREFATPAFCDVMLSVARVFGTRSDVVIQLLTTLTALCKHRERNKRLFGHTQVRDALVDMSHHIASNAEAVSLFSELIIHLTWLEEEPINMDIFGHPTMRDAMLRIAPAARQSNEAAKWWLGAVTNLCRSTSAAMLFANAAFRDALVLISYTLTSGHSVLLFLCAAHDIMTTANTDGHSEESVVFAHPLFREALLRLAPLVAEELSCSTAMRWADIVHHLAYSGGTYRGKAVFATPAVREALILMKACVGDAACARSFAKTLMCLTVDSTDEFKNQRDIFAKEALLPLLFHITAKVNDDDGKGYIATAAEQLANSARSGHCFKTRDMRDAFQSMSKGAQGRTHTIISRSLSTWLS